MLELLPPTATRPEFIAKAPQWQRVRARVVRISRVGDAAAAGALLGVALANRIALESRFRELLFELRPLSKLILRKRPSPLANMVHFWSVSVSPITADTLKSW